MRLRNNIARIVSLPRLLAAPIAVVVMLQLAATAAAVPVFEAFTETFVIGAGMTTCFKPSTAPVTCTESQTVTAPRPASLAATARSSAGTLGVFGAVDFDHDPGGSTREGRTQSSALMGFSDMIISSTLPQPAPFVVASINLDVHGTLDSNASVGPADNSFATTTVVALVEVAVESPFGGMPFRRGHINLFHSAFTTAGGGVTVQESLTESGDFVGNANLPPGTTVFPFQSLPFAMPVGHEFRIDVFLRGDVSTAVGGQVMAGGLIDFLSTVSFPTLGPVINLPEGYTLSSAQALIEDNRWVGGQPASVPQPSALSLLGLALIGLVGRYRRSLRSS